MSLDVMPPVFSQFSLQERTETPEFFINPLGARARKIFMPRRRFEVADEFQANEALFEWIDLLESVALAGTRFAMLDLGAGYGRWLVNGALACRQKDKNFFVAGVEAEDLHYQWMLYHLEDNAVTAQEYLAFHGPISNIERDVFFTYGHPTEWYGQAILPAADAKFGEWPECSVKQKRAISIVNVLNRVGCLDSIHSDVQGEEAVIFPACIDLLDERVKRVHIGTHSHEIDKQLFTLFGEHGWQSHFAFPYQSQRVVTPYGLVDFQDGVQSWINSRLS